MPLPMSTTSGVTAWATTDDVSNITGVDESTISDSDVMRAQYIIDMMSGRTYATHELLNNYQHARDLYFLKLAVAYQTVWMKAQPDMYTRLDLVNVIQDGVTSDITPSAFRLAPLAKSALRRLSWKGTRSQTVGIRQQMTLNDYMNPLAPIVDQPGEAWVDLGEIGDDDAIWVG